MEIDEADTLSRLKALRHNVVHPAVAGHRGRIVKLMGDGALIEFASVVDAVQCAIKIQQDMSSAEPNLTQDRRVVFRIGINVGDVMIDGEDIYGDGINVAARLQALASAGGIAVSANVREHVGNKLGIAFQDLGEHAVKNIEKPVRVYMVSPAGSGDEASAAHLSARSAKTEKPTIAVLPFNNMSGDPEQEYFSDGISEDIITELSRFREFMVIARNTSFQFKGRSPSIADVGRQLGVKYVIEGSVRRSGARVRVTAQLIDSETGAHVWAERYDRDIADIFAIQDEITLAVVARVAESVKGAVASKARARAGHSVSAYDLVLQARPYRTTPGRAASEMAAKLLREAIALDPEFALAYAGLAFVRAGDVEEGRAEDPQAALAEALEAAKRAVALDGSDGYAHASLAFVLTKVGEFDRAQIEADLAVELNPSHVNVLLTAGWVSLTAGNPEMGIALFDRAMRINPKRGDWEIHAFGETYLGARKHVQALECFAKVMEPSALLYLEKAICLAHLGQEREARASIETYLRLAKEEMRPFPGEDPVAWRAFLERAFTRRRREDVEHMIDGARKAGLPVA
jgi:TolB-like protein